jgi:hypothetical protein
MSHSSIESGLEDRNLIPEDGRQLTVVDAGRFAYILWSKLYRDISTRKVPSTTNDQTVVAVAVEEIQRICDLQSVEKDPRS